jgi:hypothetical protein
MQVSYTDYILTFIMEAVCPSETDIYTGLHSLISQKMKIFTFESLTIIRKYQCVLSALKQSGF